MTPLLDFSQICFSYAGRTVFENLSFTLAKGECAALIGQNGIGKTTLLRLAAGLVGCSSGSISLDGREVQRLSRTETARLVALVPQQIDVPFAFTVEQIIEQGRTAHRSFWGGLTAKDHKAVERAIELTGIGYLRHRVFNELSGGERQRVKIALGLAQEPRLLLLDEPAQNLDIGRQIELLDLIRSLNSEDVTILAAMHDLQLIEGTFSSVLLLNPNRSLIQGRPVDVLRPKILEHAFNCPPRQHPMLISQGSLRKSAVYKGASGPS